MGEDLSKHRVLWSRHATKQCLEDGFSQLEIEKAMDKCLVMDSGAGKEKAVCRHGRQYCTLVFRRYPEGLKIITCWRSSRWEVKAFKEEFK